VAYPGTSEHQTGLCCDITDKYYSAMDVSQMDQNLLTWLREHCAEYGFILRYPGNKESITGWNEPWHYRYVGVEAAKYMTENNLCLEEFRKLYE
jgi:D-alanyl-D-alanine carboxypeptidase